MISIRTTVLKTLVHTLGRLSDGVTIARRHGFTSGKMLDYVYRNQPSGRGWIGRLLDRLYLSNCGWRAVRARRDHLVSLLQRAVRRQLDACGEVLILDIASGPAGYLHHALADWVDDDVRALCWDLEEQWLAEGRRTAAALGLGNIRYHRRDALDPQSYRRLRRRPNVVIASGFYDWMPHDETIRRSLALVHDALAPGGELIFTIQTGQVHVNTTNAIFNGFDGEPLNMTVRPAELVHGWARQAGFDIGQSEVDRWHYHTVTVARKRPPGMAVKPRRTSATAGSGSWR